MSNKTQSKTYSRVISGATVGALVMAMSVSGAFGGFWRTLDGISDTGITNPMQYLFGYGVNESDDFGYGYGYGYGEYTIETGEDGYNADGTPVVPDTVVIDLTSSSSTSSSSSGGGGGGGWSSSGGFGSSSSSSTSSSSTSSSSGQGTPTGATNTGTTVTGKNYTTSATTCPILEDLRSETFVSGYTSSFGDIAGNGYSDQISRLQKAEIVVGRNVWTSFVPNSLITRAEFLAIVLKSNCYDITPKPTTLPFGDVDIASWQSNVVQSGVVNGIIVWDTDAAGNRVFRPNDPISKIEAYAIIMKIRQVALLDGDTSVNPYTDAAAAWQEEYLRVGVALEILDPSASNNLFYPNIKLNRDELVGIMFDVINLD